jgi:uridine kinase
MEKKNKKALILIAGGSGSGKTTLVKAVDEIVKKNNHTISFIRLDDYYHNQEHMTMEERRKVNYDHPKEFE